MTVLVVVSGILTGCAWYQQKQVGPGGETRVVGFALSMPLEPNTVAPAQPTRITRTIHEDTVPTTVVYPQQQQQVPQDQPQQSQLYVPLNPECVKEMGANVSAPLQRPEVNRGYSTATETVVEDYAPPTNPTWVEHIDRDGGGVVYSSWNGNVMWLWGTDSYGRRAPVTLSYRPEHLEFRGRVISRDREGNWGCYQNQKAPHCEPNGQFIGRVGNGPISQGPSGNRGWR